MELERFFEKIAYITTNFREHIDNFRSVECLFSDYLVDFEDGLKREYRLNLTGAVSAAAMYYDILERLEINQHVQDIFAEIVEQTNPRVRVFLSRFIDIAGQLYGVESKVVPWDYCIICGAQLTEKYLGRCGACKAEFEEFNSVSERLDILIKQFEGWKQDVQDISEYVKLAESAEKLPLIIRLRANADSRVKSPLKEKICALLDVLDAIRAEQGNRREAEAKRKRAEADKARKAARAEERKRAAELAEAQKLTDEDREQKRLAEEAEEAAAVRMAYNTAIDDLFILIQADMNPAERLAKAKRQFQILINSPLAGDPRILPRLLRIDEWIGAEENI